MSDYLVAAYALFWVLPFVLLLAIWVRQQRIEREIAALRQRLTEGHQEHLPLETTSGPPAGAPMR